MAIFSSNVVLEYSVQASRVGIIEINRKSVKRKSNFTIGEIDLPYCTNL